MTSRHFTWLAIALFALAWPLFGAFTITLVNYIGLYSLVAVGLVMLTGVGGITSFGQAAFVGLGAYATAWICTSPTAAQALSALPAGALPWLGLLLGLAVTALIAWFLGAVTLPLAGHFLPLGTLAWGLSLYYIFGNLDGLGGFTGITGVPALTIGGFELSSPRVLGVLIWAVLLLAIWALHNLLDSREGRAIRALKSGRVMAESMGVDTGRQRMKLFVLAALLSAVSGWLYAHLQRFVNPTPFDLNIGIEYLFMAVVGGSGHLWGAVLGATLITLLKEKLQDLLPSLLGTSGNFEVIVFGLLMVFVLQRFADDLDRDLGRLRAALDTDDFGLAEQLTHSIKGTSGNLAVFAVFDKISALHGRLRNGEHDRQPLQAVVNSIAEDLERLNAALHEPPRPEPPRRIH